MAIARVRGGALSRMTSAKAPLRRSTSAHQAACSGAFVRIAQKRPLLPNVDQSLGASVRSASMYATQRLALTAWIAMALASVVPIQLAVLWWMQRGRAAPARAGVSE